MILRRMALGRQSSVRVMAGWAAFYNRAVNLGGVDSSEPVIWAGWGEWCVLLGTVGCLAASLTTTH